MQVWVYSYSKESSMWCRYAAEHLSLANFFVAFDEIMKEQKKYFHKPKKHKVEFNKNNKNEFANEMFTNFQQGLT